MGLPSCRLRVQSPFVRAWAAANCAALPTANAGQYVTTHCKPLLLWFPIKRRCINVWTFNLSFIHSFVGLFIYSFTHRRCVYTSVCVFAAPGSAPVNVEARPLSSSTVVVQWNEPEIPNGVLQVGTIQVSMYFDGDLNLVHTGDIISPDDNLSPIPATVCRRRLYTTPLWTRLLDFVLSTLVSKSSGIFSCFQGRLSP